MIDEKQEFSKRLHAACDFAGIVKGRGRRAELARMFGVSGESARKWLEGFSIPDTKRIPEIAKKLGVRGEWLLTGIGPMQEAPEQYRDQVAEPRSPTYSISGLGSDNEVDILTLAIEAVDELQARTGKRFSAHERAKLESLIYRYLMIELELMVEMDEAEIERHEPYLGDFGNLISMEKVKAYALKKKRRAA